MAKPGGGEVSGHWDEAAATLAGARAAAWAEAPERYAERAGECAEVVLRLLGDVDRPPAVTDCVDLGCGPGRLMCAVAARRPRWSLVGADSSEAMARWAFAEAFASGSLSCAAVVADVTALPAVWAGRFDGAWSVAVMQHLDPAAQAVAVGEVGRVLRRGGRAVVQVVEGVGSAGPLSHDTDAADLRRWAASASMGVVGEARGLVQPGWLWATLERR